MHTKCDERTDRGKTICPPTNSHGGIKNCHSLLRRVMVHMLQSFWGGVMVFNVTFNNISAISWRSVLLVEETGVPGENHRGEEGANSLIISSDCLIYICWLYAYWTVYHSLSFKCSFEHTCGWGISECLYNPWNIDI